MKADLMTPRYIVIADYPDQKFKIGDVLIVFKTVKECEYYKGNGIAVLNDYDQWIKYPAIYKPLQWWERLEKDALPEYVKYESGQVRKAKWQWSTQERCYLAKDGFSNSGILPATLTDYEQYKAQQ